MKDLIKYKKKKIQMQKSEDMKRYIYCSVVGLQKRWVAYYGFVIYINIQYQLLQMVLYLTLKYQKVIHPSIKGSPASFCFELWSGFVIFTDKHNFILWAKWLLFIFKCICMFESWRWWMVSFVTHWRSEAGASSDRIHKLSLTSSISARSLRPTIASSHDNNANVAFP